MDKKETMTIQEAIAKIACSYVGIKEIPQNKGWKNKDFEKKMRKMGWRAGQAWCMYFVKLVLIEAYELLEDVEMASWCDKHLNGGVLSSFRKLKPQMTVLSEVEPEKGAIGFMQNDGRETGHSFVVERIGSRGEVITIEGNTDASAGRREGDGVYRRTRFTDSMMRSKLKLIAYIRMK